MERATITGTAPLTVTLHSSSTAVPATLLQGTSYTPAAADEVIVAVLPDGAVVVLGKYA